MDNQTDAQALTGGQQQVGVQFNPSKFPEVDRIKELAAALCDELMAQREVAKTEGNGEKIAQYTLAIRHTEDASYRGVKAATWQF